MSTSLEPHSGRSSTLPRSWLSGIRSTTNSGIISKCGSETIVSSCSVRYNDPEFLRSSRSVAGRYHGDVVASASLSCFETSPKGVSQYRRLKNFQKLCGRLLWIQNPYQAGVIWCRSHSPALVFKAIVVESDICQVWLPRLTRPSPVSRRWVYRQFKMDWNYQNVECSLMILRPGCQANSRKTTFGEPFDWRQAMTSCHRSMTSRQLNCVRNTQFARKRIQLHYHPLVKTVSPCSNPIFLEL